MSIPVFYRTEQSCSSSGSFSPSAGKPAQVIADWLGNEHLAPKIEIRSDWEPLTLDEISRAHDPKYVAAIMAGKAPNGFDNYDTAVAQSLPYTTGSFVAAVKHVAQHGGRAVSPTSGFHHACYAEAGGFCTFNGLILGALAAQDMGLKNVLILDGDAHYGNGTDDIIRKLGLANITNITAMKDYDYSTQMFGKFDTAIRKRPDIILFQAGADAHVDDPLGGGLLDDSGMTMRDSIVFGISQLHGIPLVWNLAGGYNRDAKGTIEPVLRLHRKTMFMS